MKISNRRGNLFIIGMRRSGTSILRRIIETGTGGAILFEPHDIWFAIRRAHVARIARTPACAAAVATAREHFNASGVRGAKFAVDPGVEMFNWRRIEKLFHEPRYVFIRRDQRDTFASYWKLDHAGVRGAVIERIHRYFWNDFYADMEAFADAHPDRAMLVDYEDLLRQPKATLAAIFTFLNCADAPIDELAATIELPEQRRALSP